MYPASALSHIASQYCLASTGRQNVTELLWDVCFHPLRLYLTDRKKQGNRFYEKNYKLLCSPGSVFRNESALRTGMDQCSCMRTMLVHTCWRSILYSLVWQHLKVSAVKLFKQMLSMSCTECACWGTWPAALQVRLLGIAWLTDR